MALSNPQFWLWSLDVWGEVDTKGSPFSSYLNALCILQEAEAHGLQCLLRPLMEPVDSSTVHNGWELPASVSQLVPHRGETESHLRHQKGRENQESIREVHREAGMGSGCWSRQLKSMPNFDRIFPCEPILLAKTVIMAGLLHAWKSPVHRGKWYLICDAQPKKRVVSSPPPPEIVQRDSVQIITSCNHLCPHPCPCLAVSLSVP